MWPSKYRPTFGLAPEQTLRARIGVSGEPHPWWHYYFWDNDIGASCWY